MNADAVNWLKINLKVEKQLQHRG